MPHQPDLGALVPCDADLPGEGWLAITGELGLTGASGAGELLDCVGPEFPEHALVGTEESPRFLRPPGQLVFGLAASFSGTEEADRAGEVLRGGSFAACLARSVVADLAADQASVEILDVEVAPLSDADGPIGHRATFTGGDEAGLASVHLDVAVLQAGCAAAVVWFGGFVDPVPTADRDHVLGALRRRVELRELADDLVSVVSEAVGRVARVRLLEDA